MVARSIDIMRRRRIYRGGMLSTLSMRERFVGLILAGDRGGALELSRAALVHGVEYLYEEIVRPALERVGQMWLRGEITVADEHLATAVVQTVVGALYVDFVWPPRGPPAIVACVEGERHELGPRMVADLLTLDGWDGLFLGADVPMRSLLDMVRRVQPVLVAVSATTPAHRDALERTVQELRALSPTLKILVGGRVTDPAEFAAPPGADARAGTAREAVEVARAWKP